MSQKGTLVAPENFRAEPSLTDGVPRDFRRIDEGHYCLGLEQLGIEFVVDRLRRKWDELIGELTVHCDLAGARTFDGVLSVADFNLSSARARQDRARLLAERSKAPDLDWAGLLEEFVQRVLTAERTGEPAIDLCAMAAPPAAETLEIDGLRLLRDHAAIVFGDGGSLKSYLALYVAGRLTQQGHRVLFADWELDAVDHHQRLRCLFKVDLAPLYYVRCDRPLTAELDRLRRLVREHAITYIILDSIAYGCDGPPEAAEVANRYCRAVRQLRVGALLTAHINRSDSGDQKPFGSIYWHNSARVTWFAKAETTAPDGRTATIGLFNRKFNHGPPLPAVAFEVTFEDERTVFRRTSVADNPDLAVRLPLWQRMAHLLRRGPVTGRGDCRAVRGRREHGGEDDCPQDPALYPRAQHDRREPNCPDGAETRMSGPLSRDTSDTCHVTKGHDNPPSLEGGHVLSPRLLNIRQAATYLGVSFWSVRDWVLAGYVPVVSLPPLRPRDGERARTTLRRVVVDRVDLDAFIESRKR